MHASSVKRLLEIIFAGPIFVRSVVDRINLAIRFGRGCEENGRAAEVSTNLQNISRSGFHRFPEQGRFIEPLSDQTAIAAVASEEPGQIFEASTPARGRLIHAADESLSSRGMQDVALVSHSER